MINLITSFYLPKNEKRLEEIVKSLNKNIECKIISKIHLFLDSSACQIYLNKNINLEKINIIEIGKQPLYSDLFRYANSIKNEICMISNADIWLYNITDNNILKLLQKNIIFALTRHEHDLTCPQIDSYQGSHDSFIFKAPLNISLKHIQHPQNILGSENVLLYELNKLKKGILNPCKCIVIVHEHKSNYRNYSISKRINRGDNDGDGVYKIRNMIVPPC